MVEMVTIAFVVLVIGLIVYLAASYPWTKGTWGELGRISYFAGLLALLVLIGGKTVL